MCVSDRLILKCCFFIKENNTTTMLRFQKAPAPSCEFVLRDKVLGSWLYYIVLPSEFGLIYADFVDSQKEYSVPC